MAKQTGDAFTLDLLDKPKRGRPRKPDAKSDAQRAREYRARQRAAKLAEVPPSRNLWGSTWTARELRRMPRYLDRRTGATWSGRGQQPAWVRVALQRGKTLADFDVWPRQD